jgi:hypothetical protein
MRPAAKAAHAGTASSVAANWLLVLSVPSGNAYCEVSDRLPIRARHPSTDEEENKSTLNLNVDAPPMNL